jgi:hypothetical protein
MIITEQMTDKTTSYGAVPETLTERLDTIYVYIA